MRLILPTPELPTTPGQPTPVEVVVWNDSDVHDQVRVRALGVEDAWSAPPQVTPVLAPDERHTIQFVVTLPEGFPPGGHSCAFEATSVSGHGAHDDGHPVEIVRTELTVRVEDLSNVSVQLEPRRVLDNGRFRVRIQNHSLLPVRLHLSGRSAGDTLGFRFRADDVEVRPGGQAVVKSRIVGRRHVFGDPRKTSFTVVAQGQSRPVHLSGTWERSAALRSNLLKAMAILAVIAIWAGAAVIGISEIRDRSKPAPVALGDEALQDQLGDGDGSGPDGAGADDGSGTGTGSGSGSGSGSGAGAGAGAGSDGDAGDDAGGDSGSSPGSGSDSSGGPAGDPDAIDPTSPGAGRVVTSIGGVVEGKGGDGVSVQLRPVNPAALPPDAQLPDDREPAGGGGGLAALGGGGAFASGAEIGKQLGRLANTFFRIDQMQSATTTTDGVWSFGGVEGPGFYEARFGKQGFSTKSAVVEIDSEGRPVRLDLSLDEAYGRIVGTVVDTNGSPIPGAAIVVGDGLIEAKTTADGSGSFSVDGLTQYTQYTVAASADGYGTGFASVRLEGEQSAPVALTLTSGVATIFGTVMSTRDDVLVANNGTLELANATVTVTDGAEVTRSISSLDNGFFQIGGLPRGGPYTVRIEADQHLAQVQTVMLTGDELELNVTLTGANGRVQGDVVTADDGTTPLHGVGVRLTSDFEEFKTLTDANGAYDVVDVPPGDYTATYTLFGFTEQVVNVTVGAGAVTMVDTVVMEVDDREAFPANGSLEITAFLADEPDTKLEGLSVFVNDELRGVTDDTGFLRVEGLTAGTAFIRINDLRPQPIVAEFTRPINISENSTVDVQAGMRRLASLKGSVSGPTVASVGTGGAPNIVRLPDIAVCIVPQGQGATYLDPRAGSCLQHVPLLADTTTRLDGTFEFETVPSGTHDVVFQSVRNVPGSGDPVSYLYEPTINQYTFNAGASLENEDILLDLYPIASVEVSRPDEGAGAGGSDDLSNFVAVGAGDATVRFFDSSGTSVLFLLDPATATPDAFAVAEEADVDSAGTVDVQLLTSEPDITAYALSKVPALGRPVSTPLGELRGTGLQVQTATNARFNVAIPLVTNEDFVGSLKYGYHHFPVSAGVTTDGPQPPTSIDPGSVPVTVSGTFDAFGSSAAAPATAEPRPGAARSVTTATDASGTFALRIVEGEDVPAGATVDVTAGGGTSGFESLEIPDVAVPQNTTLAGTLVPSARHEVRGVLRYLCAGGGSCPTADRDVGGYGERNAPGVDVTLVSAGDPTVTSRTTTTDSSGGFRFGDVPVGQHRIVVTDESRVWHHTEASGSSAGDRAIARILVDVTPDGVVYRPDDATAAAEQYPAPISTTSTDPAGVPVAGGGAYIGFIDMAKVTANVTNVNTFPTRVELWRSPLLPAAVAGTCPATGDYTAQGFTSEGVHDLDADGAVEFEGLERLDHRTVIDPTTGVSQTSHEYFCLRATRAEDDGEAVPVPELLRDGRVSAADPLRPLTATVDVAMKPMVRFHGSVQSFRGTYKPTATSVDVEIVDVLSGAEIEVFDTATATTCGTTSRTPPTSSDGAGAFTTEAVLGAADHCVQISAEGHETKQLPRGASGESPPDGTDDLGTVELAADKPDLTVNLVDTFGDAVALGSGSVSLRFTPGGAYADADAAFPPAAADPTSTSVTFPDLVPTIYELVIDIPGYAEVTKTVNVQPTSQPDVTLETDTVLVDGDPDAKVELEGTGQAVVGSVKVRYGTGADAKLAALPGGVDFAVSVSRKNEDLSSLVTENQAGDTFSADLPTGNGYTFEASAPGFDGIAQTDVRVQPNNATPSVDLVLVPRTRNVAVPIDGITGATDEMVGTVVSLEAVTGAGTDRPGSPYTGSATVSRSGSETARAVLTNVVPGTYRLKIDVPARLPGYRDLLSAGDQTSYPPTGGSLTVEVGWSADGGAATVPTITLAVYKRLELLSGEGANGRPMTVAEACTPSSTCTLEAQPDDPPDAAVFFTYTVTGADPTQRSLAFAATGHDAATISVTADGTVDATQTVCLTKSAVTARDDNGTPDDESDDFDTVVAEADDCSGISGVLTG